MFVDAGEGIERTRCPAAEALRSWAGLHFPEVTWSI
jgi:hypothetical protein